MKGTLKVPNFSGTDQHADASDYIPIQLYTARIDYHSIYESEYLIFFGFLRVFK